MLVWAPGTDMRTLELPMRVRHQLLRVGFFFAAEAARVEGANESMTLPTV